VNARKSVLSASVTLVVVTSLVGLGCLQDGSLPGGDTLRLMIQTRGSTHIAELEERLSEFYDRSVTVEPLFADVDPEDDPVGLSRMFVAVVPDIRAPDDKPWDLAYQLTGALGFERVGPDLDDALLSATERGVGSCTVGDSTPAPTDYGWSVRNVRADKAWQLEPEPGGARFGEGVRICHPDTGWTVHYDLDPSRLDLERATNLLDEGPANGQDPLNYSGSLKHPGHGTGTGSVIISQGGLTDPAGTSEPGFVTGVAPAATLVPIRCARSVIRVFDSKLARAVHHATAADCDVISISLGGPFFFGLEAAIEDAVRRGKIVVAAAGNCVRYVVAPASYDACIAVAGTNVADRPWKGSSRGWAVTISAPGEHVWRAHRESPNDSVRAVGPGEGTSFAVATVAGVAALWLSHHGLDATQQRYSGEVTVQQAFAEVLRRSARPVSGLDSDKYGPGIVDAEAALLVDLDQVDAGMTARRAPTQAIDHFAAMVDRDPAELRQLLAQLLGVSIEDVDESFERWGAELAYLALHDPDGFDHMLDSMTEERPAAERSARVTTWAGPRASRALRAAMDFSG